MNRPDKNEWLLAMNDEMNSLKKNQVYELIDRISKFVDKKITSSELEEIESIIKSKDKSNKR